MERLIAKLRAFVRDREWESFHAPKNVVMALAVELGELMEHFQWLTPAQSDALSDEAKAAVRAEIGDVVVYLLLLCERLGIDPIEAAGEKLDEADRKYPADEWRGR